tara:strand:+ start:1189 stop:2097 length:909 start_codon:yes stop_codon:yes gene_type:complete
VKYVVTGGAGFIGSNLVDKLIEKKNDVSVIDNFSTGKKENCNPNAEYYDLDISKMENISKIKEILLGCDSVFHCAALARVQPSIKDPITYEINNTLGIINMLKSSVDSKIKRFIYSASSSAYGPTEIFPSSENHSPNPISPYANQKYYGELCCRMFTEVYGIETVSLRYFNVYGERQNLGGAYATVVGIFLKQKLDNLPFTVNGDGNQRRDFTYVGDVVNANILASSSSNVGEGEVINIGTGKNYSINELAEMIGGLKEHLKPVNEPFQNLADISKAKKVLNWEPKMEISDWIKRYKISMEI